MSFLKNIFKKKKDEPVYPPLSDYSVFATDIHSHLIPGIDDGSQSMEESVSLVKSLAELGFKKLVTTPHIMSDSYRNTPEIILGGLDKLKKEVAAQGINIVLDAAAEYYLDEGFAPLIEQNNLLAINGKYLLFEISYINPPSYLSKTIFDINVKGYIPLLAHPERYPFWFDKFEEYHRLKEAGALFQMNINSLCGYYGLAVKKTAERLVDENMIDFVGSDLHGMRHVEGLQKCIHEKYLWKLVAKGVRNSSL